MKDKIWKFMTGTGLRTLYAFVAAFTAGLAYRRTGSVRAATDIGVIFFLATVGFVQCVRRIYRRGSR